MFREKKLLVAILLISLCACGGGGDDGSSIVGPSPIVPDLSGTWEVSYSGTGTVYFADNPDVGITASGSGSSRVTISQTGDTFTYTGVSYSATVAGQTVQMGVGVSGSGKVSGTNTSLITQESYTYSFGNCVVQGTGRTSGTLSGNTWSYSGNSTETSNNASDCGGIGSASAQGTATAIRQ